MTQDFAGRTALVTGGNSASAAPWRGSSRGVARTP